MELKHLSPRKLAHLGDAVFHLHERERAILDTGSLKQLHVRLSSRVSASGQACLLEQLKPHLNLEEQRLVQRARNVKSHSHKRNQDATRNATAFEALLGYLYLDNPARLKQILAIVDQVN